MTSPFPGMNPYLEDKTIWPGFHHRLADEVADRLNAQVGPKYYADVEVHTVFDAVSIGVPKVVYPDVGVFEPSPATSLQTAGVGVSIPPAPIQRLAVAGQTKLHTVRVYDTETDELVTAIQLLSPHNKRGHGLADYRRKRSKILAAPVHLVEIDLLCGGQHPGHEANDPPLDEAGYVLLVNRHRTEAPRRISDIWPVTLDNALPLLPVPLIAPDPDVPLDLNAAIEAIYQRAGYAWRLDCEQPCPTPGFASGDDHLA